MSSDPKKTEPGDKSYRPEIEFHLHMAELGLDELEEEYMMATAAADQLKQAADRARAGSQIFRNQAEDYRGKAVKILYKMKEGRLDAVRAEELAAEALRLKDHKERQADRLVRQAEEQDIMAENIRVDIQELRKALDDYRASLATLENTVSPDEAMAETPENISAIGEMLEVVGMEIEREAAVSEAFLDLAGGGRDIDDEIDRALGQDPASKARTALKKLKKEMGIV